MITKNFSENELSCSCPCKENGMEPFTLNLLQELRDLYGKPISLSSAYRCATHNSKVSKSGKSGPHTTGKAVDIRCFGTEAHEILRLALSIGFTGIGVSQKNKHKPARFIHIDTISSTKANRPWTWSY